MSSVAFFETQFQRQVSAGEFVLNPFERLALPYLAGEILGLLMFFPRARAETLLADIVAHVKPGGVAVLNVLTEGTTFLGMFEAGHYHLFPAGALKTALPGWRVQAESVDPFPAGNDSVKGFDTLIARRP